MNALDVSAVKDNNFKRLQVAVCCDYNRYLQGNGNFRYFWVRHCGRAIQSDCDKSCSTYFFLHMTEIPKRYRPQLKQRN